MPLIRKPAAPDATPAPDVLSSLASLRSPDAEQRWSAARALATLEHGDMELARALRTETDPRVREAMLTSLALIATPVALQPLILLLRSAAAADRTQALDALRMRADLHAVAQQLLRDADPDVRILSCELARALPATQSNRLLAELLDEEGNANVCAAAIEVLAEVGDRRALPGLGRCAQRFASTQFLMFAITMVVDRIHANDPSARD